MDGRSSTHEVEMRADVVVKRYRSRDNGEPLREWRALTLLHEHTPGTAPAPISADLDAEPPTVVMSRLDGVPLDGEVTADLAAAVAGAVARAQEAIPLRTLAGLPARAGTADAARVRHRRREPRQLPVGRHRGAPGGLRVLGPQ
ncbi:hypothetical protein [Actinomadura latina]|uniref:hypothetical protein n=1 Tax=Actinomadura latina TaxID=163603 RepID=UPI000AED09B4|nr:hypothetical protein [Actinomadura latina]